MTTETELLREAFAKLKAEHAASGARFRPDICRVCKLIERIDDHFYAEAVTREILAHGEVLLQDGKLVPREQWRADYVPPQVKP